MKLSPKDQPFLYPLCLWNKVGLPQMPQARQTLTEGLYRFHLQHDWNTSVWPNRLTLASAAFPQLFMACWYKVYGRTPTRGKITGAISPTAAFSHRCLWDCMLYYIFINSQLLWTTGTLLMCRKCFLSLYIALWEAPKSKGWRIYSARNLHKSL